MVTGHALMLAAAPIVGLSLTTDPTWVTLPVALHFLVMMATSLPAAFLMKRIGRRAGFLLGNVCGIAGALVAAYGIWQRDFLLFNLGLALNGVLSGFGTYYRFAAAEAAGADYRSRAISYVLAGGVVAAVVGTTLARVTEHSVPQAPFMGSYLSVMAIYLLAIVALLFVDIPAATSADRRKVGRSYGEIARHPAFIVALIGGTFGFGVMNLIMMATPLAMHDHHYPFGDVALVIQWHMLGMFAPSFVSGRLIARFGVVPIMLWGVVLCGACLAINLMSAHFWALSMALILLGVGWNFLFVGATTLLTETYRPEERAKIEGLNDFLIIGVITTFSFSAGALHHHLGWALVNVLVIPMLLGVALAIAWLARQRSLTAA
jgi:MFS family permease